MARILACVFRWTRQNIKNKQTAREKERERVNESERVYREKNPKLFSLYSEMRLVVLLFSPFAFFLSLSLSFSYSTRLVVNRFHLPVLLAQVGDRVLE